MFLLMWKLTLLLQLFFTRPGMSNKNERVLGVFIAYWSSDSTAFENNKHGKFSFQDIFKHTQEWKCFSPLNFTSSESSCKSSPCLEKQEQSISVTSSIWLNFFFLNCTRPEPGHNFCTLIWLVKCKYLFVLKIQLHERNLFFFPTPLWLYSSNKNHSACGDILQQWIQFVLK